MEPQSAVPAMSLLLLALLALAPCRPASSGPAPPFYGDILRQCDVKDQESLDRCLHHILTSMRPYLSDGIPEWKIPVMEPLAIRGVSLNQGGGNTRLRATFKDLRVAGLSNYTVTYVKSSPADGQFSLGLQFPRLHVTGAYSICGTLMLIPIKGHGPFWADFRDVKADSYNGVEVTHPTGPAGPGRLALSHTQTDFDISDVRLRLEQLFNNDEFLGETVNTFLNENAHDIVREVKPQFAQEIDRLVKRVFSEAIASLPADLWADLGRHDAEADGTKASKADKAS